MRQMQDDVRKRGGKENKPIESPRVRVLTLRHVSNAQRLSFVLQYEQLCLDFMWLSVDEVQVHFHRANPGTPVNTLKKWLVSRDTILADAHHSSPLKVRTSQVSAARLVQYKVGQFPQAEITLYSDIERRHHEGLMISSVWVMAKMKEMLNGNELAHKCTRGWLNGFLARFRIDFRLLHLYPFCTSRC